MHCALSAGNSGIRVAVGDCSVTEHRRWRPHHQTAKLYMCTQTHYKHDEDGRTAPGVRGHGFVYENRTHTLISYINYIEGVFVTRCLYELFGSLT